MEKEFDVKAVEVAYICDSCQVGEMRYTGKMEMYEEHAEFIHKCNNCSIIRELENKYPLIGYKRL